MSRFDIKYVFARNAAAELNNIANRLNALDSQIRDVKSQLRMNNRAGGTRVRQALQTTLDNLNREKRSLVSLSRSLSDIVTKYIQTENRISGTADANLGNGNKLPYNIKLILEKIKKYGPFKGSSNKTTQYSYDPVNLSTGNFIYDIEDLSMGDQRSKFAFKRFYNSQNEYEGVLGHDWNHNFEVHLRTYVEENISCAEVMLEDGKDEVFAFTEEGYWAPVNATSSVLTETEDHFLYYGENRNRYFFSKEGIYLRQENYAGFGFALEYDEKQKLSKVIRDTGEAFMLEYDDKGYLQSVTDHAGRIFCCFVEGGKLLRTMRPDEASYVYGYDDNGKLISVMDPEGVITVTNEYDDEGRTTRQTFPDGSEMKYEYDDENRCIKLTERNGSEQFYYRDEQERLIRTVYSDGEISYTYNDRNQKTAVKDKRGNITRYSYDRWGNITSIINPLGTNLSMTFGSHEMPLTVCINGKLRMKNEFNPLGKITSSEDALHRRIEFEYGANGWLEHITLQDGSIEDVKYDDRGNVVSIIDPRGSVTGYAYDDLNRVIEVIDPAGIKTCLEYDENDNLVSEINAEGKKRSYIYDKNSRLVQTIDYDGSIVRRTYNSVGRLASIIDAQDRVTELEYDSMWNISAIKTPAGAMTKYIYDDSGNVIQVENPDGGIKRFEYDGNGNCVAVEDEEGARVNYGYDEANRLTVAEGENGERLVLTYDEEGNVIKAEDALHNTVDMVYDEAGQLISEKSNTGKERYYTYTAMGELETTTDESGRWAKNTYAPGGTLITKTEYSDGTTEEYTYSPNGLLEGVKERNGVKTALTYNHLGQLISEKTEDSVRKYGYDASGNIADITDELGNKTQYFYSVSGELTGVRDALGNETHYKYDEDDYLSDVIRTSTNKNDEPRTIHYDRDLMGRITAIVRGDGSEDHYTYNRRGELLSCLDEDGYLTQYEYTKSGEINKVKYADGREVCLTFNALRQLEQIKDWNGTTEVENDAAGRAVSVTDPDGKVVRYQYGKGGEKRILIYPDGREVRYDYDDQLRLTSVKSGEQIWSYEFDDVGRVKEKTFPGGIKMSLSYTTMGQLEQLSTSDSKGILDKYTFRYNAAGNRVGIDKQRRGLDKENGIYDLEYDPIGRLTNVIHNGLKKRSYEYDAFGNRISKTEYDTNGTEIQRTTYKYSKRDQLISESRGKDGQLGYDYDRRGNLRKITKNGVTEKEYVFGALNRLEKATKSDGIGADYHYNGLGARIGKNIFDNGQASGSIGKVRYINDLTRGFHNLLSKEEGGSIQQYVYDFGPVGVMSTDGTSALSLIHDDLGSIVRLIDADGNLSESYGYDEFGMDALGTQGNRQPFGYTGYRSDDISGTYHAQAREYMPLTAGFISADLVKGVQQIPQTYNEYLYCNNSPFDYVDLNGMFAILTAIVVGAVAGAAISAGVNAVSQGIEIARSKGTDNPKTWSWGKFAGATVSGAISGGVGMIPGLGPVASVVTKTAAGAVGAFADSTISQVIDNKDHSVNWGKVGEDTLVGGVSSLVFCGVDKVAGKIGKKVFGSSGGSVSRWKTFWKEATGVDSAKDNTARALAQRLWAGHAAGSYIGDKAGVLFDKYAKKYLRDKVLESVNGGFKSALRSFIGIKTAKSLFSDGLKNLLPFYKGDNEKSFCEVYEDYWDNLLNNINCIAKGNLLRTSPVIATAGGGGGGGSW